jgi:hypothetical protein
VGFAGFTVALSIEEWGNNFIRLTGATTLNVNWGATVKNYDTPKNYDT